MTNKNIQQKIYSKNTSDIADHRFRNLMSTQVSKIATKSIKNTGRDCFVMPVLFRIMDIVTDYIFKDQD